MKKYLGIIVIIVTVLVLNAFHYFQHPETQILNGTLKIALQAQTLPLTSGVINQDDSNLYESSATLVKDGINYSYQIYDQLAKFYQPQKFINQKMSDAINRTEWEQNFDSKDSTNNYSEQRQRESLLNQLHSGQATALEYSKLITIPKVLLEPIFKQLDLELTSDSSQERIKVICQQSLEKIADNFYRINSQQKLDFSVIVDTTLQDQDLAIFLENIPVQNYQEIAAIVAAENQTIYLYVPKQIIIGKPVVISYRVPGNTFLTKFSVSDINRENKYLIKEVLPGKQKAIPFFWDGTKDGLELANGKYIIKVEHFDQQNKLIKEHSAIVLLTTEQQEQLAEDYFILEKTAFQNERNFSLIINNLISGAFRLKIIPVKDLNKTIHDNETVLMFSLSKPSERHSSVYFDKSQVVVSVKDSNNLPIKEGFVKLIGDQGFNSSWQQLDHNGIVSFKYLPSLGENITAYLDIVAINKLPLLIKK